MNIAFTLNGNLEKIDCNPVKPLIDVLRYDFKLLGTKKRCGKGECGACLVFLDNMLVNSCIIPAFRIDGCDVITIEGLAKKKSMQEIEKAFSKLNLVRCGICIPGFIMIMEDLLSKNPYPSENEIRQVIGGHVCECNSQNIKIKAFLLASQIKKKPARPRRK